MALVQVGAGQTVGVFLKKNGKGNLNRKIMIQNETFEAYKSKAAKGMYVIEDKAHLYFAAFDSNTNTLMEVEDVKSEHLPALSDICAKIQAFEAGQTEQK